jgi:hypothetical protein
VTPQSTCTPSVDTTDETNHFYAFNIESVPDKSMLHRSSSSSADQDGKIPIVIDISSDDDDEPIVIGLLSDNEDLIECECDNDLKIIEVRSMYTVIGVNVDHEASNSARYFNTWRKHRYCK